MKQVYQLSDLSSRDLLDAGADKPAKLAVIGKPVAHSASPNMHQAALDALEINARYIRLEVAASEVAEAIKMMRQLGFIGCNVTVPHKFEVMACCDELTDDAKALGAVNTLLFGEKTIGHNTDAPGLVSALKEDFNINLADKSVMIIGVGGGAGSAVATQCARMGCPELYLVNRTVEKATELSESLKSSYPQTFYTSLSPSDPLLNIAFKNAEVIINATSLGLKSNDSTPIDTSLLQKHHLVYDMIYKPAETEFLKQAASKNAKTANGLSMLLHQGVLAFQFWFPETQPLDNMRSGLLSTL